MLASDLDGDGTVGFADFLVLSKNYNRVVIDHSLGDINCDGVVGMDDFREFSLDFGNSVERVEAVS